MVLVKTPRDETRKVSQLITPKLYLHILFSVHTLWIYNKIKEKIALFVSTVPPAKFLPIKLSNQYWRVSDIFLKMVENRQTY